MSAATSTSSDPNPSPPQTTREINFRNPNPLTATQEAQVRDIYYRRVRDHCAAEIKEFAECAVNRTFSATWICRTERIAMNSCMVAHAKPEEHDRAREEWFASREERRKARLKEEKEKEDRRTQIITMMREDEAKRKKEEEEARKAKSGGLFGWGKG